MRQCGGLSQFRNKAVMQQRLFEKQIVGDRAGDLRRFDAVSQSRSIEIRLTDAENLRLSLQPPECRAMQNAVPVSLGRMPVIFGRHRVFEISTFQQEIIHRS